MWIVELLLMELSLDWLWRRLPRAPEWFGEIVDIVHFTILVNGAVLVVAVLMAPSAFFDPISVPDLGTFAARLLAVSLPVWCLTFGLRFRSVLRGQSRGLIQGRRRDPVEVAPPVEAEPPGLWDEWLDGPVWNRPR